MLTVMSETLAAEENLSIGDVVAHLKDRWPEIIHSMIRFWEREGLISPWRTEGGPRLYYRADLQLLELIAELRQRRYLPLGAVKHILKELGSHPTYDLNFYDEFFRPDDFDPDFQPLSEDEAASKSGLTLNQLRALDRLGFFPGREECSQLGRFDDNCWLKR